MLSPIHLQHVLHRCTSHKRRSSTRRRFRNLAVEALEGRAMLTTLTVTSLSDAGTLDSYRQSVDIALEGLTDDAVSFRGSDSVELFLMGRNLRDFRDQRGI